MAKTQHVDQIYIKVDGQQISPQLTARLNTVEVDDSLYLADTFTININDYGLETLDQDFFKVGKSVEIGIQLAGTEPTVTLIKAEITSVEPDLTGRDRSTLTVRGYDRSHKLNRIRKTATFQNVSDSDLATRLAQEGGLQASVDSTTPVYPYLMQANQTNWEFLMERARRIGFRCYVEDRTLNFKKPPTPSPIPLKYGPDVETFLPRVSTMGQISEVTVRGWDPGGKAAIVGRATSPSSSVAHRKDNGADGGSLAQRAHSVQGKQLITDVPVYNQAEANKVAQAALDRAAASLVYAEGKMGGNPNIVAGAVIDLQNFNSRFNGQYLITRALHRYSAREYTTQFWVGGDGNNTMTGLLAGGGNGGPSNGIGGGGGGGGGGGRGAKPTYGGVTVGIVTNNKDAENMGRVKVKLPMLGDNVESYWCRMASIMSGPGQGVAFFPEAGDEVVVAFANGDPNHGYVIGCVWNGSDATPKPIGELVNGSKTLRRVMRSRVGHEIMLVDAPASPEQIIIMDKTKNNFIKIITDNNKIHIECVGDIVVTSKTGNITATAETGNITVKASAAKVTVDGMSGVDVKSTAKVSINGTAGVDIQSSGIINIKGTMVNIN
ncbi:MAG TPA: VgrG-related protein [Chloroflexia bacterium]|jgi:phage protein D